MGKVNSTSNNIIQLDGQYVSPSYPRAHPFVIDHGKGVEVWDVDGNRYLDFAAGIAVVATGHSHPRVVNAITQQAQKFIHISSDFYHEPMAKLAQKLSQIAPFEEDAKVFFTNSGTESVEAAIKLARYHTGRSQIIGFLGGFHGRTYGSMTLTASKNLYHRGFLPLMNGVVHAPYPDPFRPMLKVDGNEGYGERVVRYIEEEILGRLVSPEDTAAIIVEPIQGEGGYIVPEASFFPALRNLCDKYGILMIADEVQSGMGRTGKWWAIENFNVEPDIICSAKGIASGMPFGAMIARKSIMSWPKGSHGNTYGGNPLGCVAALATIELLEEQYLKNVQNIGPYVMNRLLALKNRYPMIGDVRGIGLMIGIEFVNSSDDLTPNPSIRDAVEKQLFTNGLITLGCGKSTLRLSPPLCITKDEVDEGIAILEKTLEEVMQFA